MPIYHFAGQGSITDNPAVHLFHSDWSINGYLKKPREGKLWPPSYHTGPVSRGKEFEPTTGSRTTVKEESAVSACSTEYAFNFTFTIHLHYVD